MTKPLPLLLVLALLGCNAATLPKAPSTSVKSLTEAKQGFTTNVTNSGEAVGPAEMPPAGGPFELIQYTAPAGELAAYVTTDPGDGQKHPAIVWITGGDNNSIGDVWSPGDRSNDQSAAPFREAGIVMMFPSQRGGNDNPGQREGFLGEVDDVLAAAEHLATLPYVDPNRIYLGGHSTGGTLAMLVGESTDRFKAIFALGPVASPVQYGGDYVYCDVNNDEEIALRSPIHWLKDVKQPMYVIEGADQGNWDGSIDMMAKENTNSNIHFFPVPGHDHFSVIAPVAELLAGQIVAGNVNVTAEMLEGLR